MGVYFSHCCPNVIDYKKADYNTNRNLIRTYTSTKKPNYEKAADIYFWMITNSYPRIGDIEYDTVDILDQLEYWRIGTYYYNKLKNSSNNGTSAVRAKYFLSKVSIYYYHNNKYYDDWAISEIDEDDLEIMLEYVKKRIPNN